MSDDMEVSGDIEARLRLVARIASNPEWDSEDWLIGVRPAFLLEAADEIERLRALITAWADAEDAEGGYSVPISAERLNASKSLRKAVGR